MNDILTGDKWIYFLFLFAPGFISLKIYDMLIPNEKRDFSKSWFDAVAYSAFNFAVLSPLLITSVHFDLSDTHPIWQGIIAFFSLFICPICWPFLFRWMQTWRIFPINPILKPWDFVFSKREPYWVIVHFKDGKYIGGVYSSESHTSTYPAKEQIYLQEVWEVDITVNPPKFIKKVERTKGIIILSEEIRSIELLR